jgi:hypothetical protein
MSELSHGLDNGRPTRGRKEENKSKPQRRRDALHNRAKKKGNGDFLFNWVPDDWANFTAYVMGIDDRLTPKSS